MLLAHLNKVAEHALERLRVLLRSHVAVLVQHILDALALTALNGHVDKHEHDLLQRLLPRPIATRSHHAENLKRLALLAETEEVCAH